MTNTPVISPSDNANLLLNEAREAHEKYLIKQQEADLEKAIEYYIDAIKLDPGLSESYYRLASLLLIKGQITVEGALEQCRTAISLEPGNVNAHIYSGYFQISCFGPQHFPRFGINRNFIRPAFFPAHTEAEAASRV